MGQGQGGEGVTPFPPGPGCVRRSGPGRARSSANSLPALLSPWPVLCLPSPGCELSLSRKSGERSEMPEQ